MTDVTVKRTGFLKAAADASEKYKGSLNMIESGVDYSDGEWHGWNGGECPVHQMSEIDLKWMTRDGLFGVDHERIASNYNWPTPCLFRVTRRHVEPPKPREFWANEYDWGFSYLNDSKAKADENATEARIRCIRVREVIEE